MRRCIDPCACCYPAPPPPPPPYQVTFGTVVSAGAAKDTDKWGVSAACRPSLRGIVLTVFSPFPGAEDLKDWSFEKSTAKERALEEYTDMQQVCVYYAILQLLRKRSCCLMRQ
jgi:hypothetical protein